MVSLLLAALLGLPDKGIYPEFDDKVRIAAPPWTISAGAAALRLDPVHHVLTLYQGDAPLVAYALAEGAPAARSLAAVLPLLGAADREDLRRRVPADVAVRTRVPGPEEDRDGDGIVDSLDILRGAKKLCLNRAAYKEEYRTLKYPMGDVPRTEGVCSDTVVRALRNAGWDLQREIHEEALRFPALYRLEKKPDASIDHRRLRNLLPWFDRHFLRLGRDEPERPGDVVFFDTFPSRPGADHVGIVSDRLGPSGRPLIVNNWTTGYVEQEMDLLPSVPVLYRFRAPMKPR